MLLNETTVRRGFAKKTKKKGSNHQEFCQKMERTAAEAKTSAEPVVIILRNFELTFHAHCTYVRFDVKRSALATVSGEARSETAGPTYLPSLTTDPLIALAHLSCCCWIPQSFFFLFFLCAEFFYLLLPPKTRFICFLLCG